MHKESTTNHYSEAKKSAYHELRNDYLSVNGAHPRRGDIVQSINEEGEEGELHLVDSGGRVHTGYLYRKPGSLILKFPNAPDVIFPDTSEVRKVVCFYYQQEGLNIISKKKKGRKTVGNVVDFAAWKEGRA